MTSPKATISNRGQENDDTLIEPVLSSPLSTPQTTSPELVSFQSLADQTSTPLSIMDDSCFLDIDKFIASGLESSSVCSVGLDKPTASSSQSPVITAGSPARPSDPSTKSQRNADPLGCTGTDADGGLAEQTRAAHEDNVSGSIENESKLQQTSNRQSYRRSQEYDQTKPSEAIAQPKVISPVGAASNTTGFAAQNSSAPSNTGEPSLGFRGPHSDQHEYRIDSSSRNPQYETALASGGPLSVERLPASGIATAQAQASSHCSAPQSATQAMSSTASTSNNSVPPGHQRHRNGHSSHDSRDNDFAPSHTTSLTSRVGGIKLDTSFVKPTPRPIVRTAPDSPSLNIQHPTPDITSQARSGAYVGNIAQLEATAERLSMTSSIDDAIRDLHTELKRSDSRRSSILAASVKASGSIDDYTSNPGSAIEQLRRHPSIASSIVSTNNAARHGGYSPGGYVLSPNHSFTGRLRSGSKNSAGRPDFDLDTVLSRHGPGKASVRSVRSTKVSLAEISESEPIALTQDVLDMADKTPVKNPEGESLLPDELRDANMPATDVFQNMMGDDDFMNSKNEHPHPDASTGLLADQESRDPQRPGSSHSDTTFQQCQDAFGDFDGVHWVPEQDDPYSLPDDLEPQPQPRPRQRQMSHSENVRPQSYFDPESGQQMLYYPARVPAMLNLPPKLSNKPKANERNKRRSQVMSAMFEGNRQSKMLDVDAKAQERDTTRDSWLPDPLAGHRESFAALSSDGFGNLGQEPETIRSVHSDQDVPPTVQPEANANAPIETLRRPQRLSRNELDKRKSRMSNLPPQLRASAYFDLPDNTQGEIEVKDGSAMATLESILDASANAPVSAFTDHERAGRLGKEVYGKEKKRASVAASTALQPEGDKKHARKRSSFMWLGKRHSHVSDDDKDHKAQSESGLGPVNADTNANEHDGLARSVDGRSDGHSDDEQQAAKEEAEDLSDEEGYNGPPTTLLAELQLRKQQQKERTQRTFPGGMHATLLEMDAVAETQKKARNNKRINLAWEDGQAQAVDEDSDDEDIPLAVIAARNQGAKNVMDLQRPIGLMERREMEENEPLSHRRARLHGQDPRSMVISHRPSMNNLSANHLPTTPHSAHQSVAQLSVQNASTEPDDEFEGETLADRKRRLAAKEEAENLLPKARPVSSAFSVELLNQFEDPEEKKKKEEENKPKSGEEETLGQRRKRLQAEREAREREMSFNQLNASAEEAEAPIPGINGRMHQLSSVLSAHPKRETNQAQEERARMEHERRLLRERDAKMAAYRSQMPQALGGPSNAQSGGYRGGTFNNGLGGQNSQAAMSSPALHTQLFNQPALNHRKSAVFSTYGAPMQQAPYGGSATNLGAMNMGYNGMPNGMSPYGAGAMSVYGGGMLQPGMQMPGQGGSTNRIEQWRQGVHP
ncbi:hypothetical protein BFJ66_g2620 [Fusarium oxysporum f. sp. cepae]|uniref:Uncharacterized protein n=1 Tax=Fusarium oxysporum f. sp. cepae TaxID=396571 RepID=A0A3L6N6M1_FUSOX|nr:hypothetical protein BFJ65_g11975 [Fusarium oxysporum f. sp. cepae]RKK58333.1 hypothetical protein BFJ67_g3030 [Fusarium oxysporum f. sp. cepae]RKK58648.1 hypothetical protein BFJ66_g2620 [Fusarium oxysporum f. sp. cepae]